MYTNTRFVIMLTALLFAGYLSHAQQDYPANVGDITFDAQFDDPSFVVCNENRIVQDIRDRLGLQAN